MMRKQKKIFFDSGDYIDDVGVFDKNGALIHSFKDDRNSFKINDCIRGKKFVVKIVFRNSVIVFLYPEELLKLGFKPTIEKYRLELNKFRIWLEKEGFMNDPDNMPEVAFDEKSYMVYAAFEFPLDKCS